jgi:hypothetical protein
MNSSSHLLFYLYRRWVCIASFFICILVCYTSAFFLIYNWNKILTSMSYRWINTLFAWRLSFTNSLQWLSDRFLTWISSLMKWKWLQPRSFKSLRKSGDLYLVAFRHRNLSKFNEHAFLYIKFRFLDLIFILIRLMTNGIIV